MVTYEKIDKQRRDYIVSYFVLIMQKINYAL